MLKVIPMHPHQYVHRHKQSCQTKCCSEKLFKRRQPWYLIPWHYNTRQFVLLEQQYLGTNIVNRLPLHMLLIELCRAPIAHCPQSPEFPCLSFSVVISLPSSSRPYRKTCWESRKINKAVPFQKSRQTIALVTDTQRLDKREKNEDCLQLGGLLSK